MPEGLKRALSRLAGKRDLQQTSPLDKLRDAGWALAEWRDFPAPWTRPEFDRAGAIDRLVDQVRNTAAMSAACRDGRDYLRMALAPVELLATGYSVRRPWRRATTTPSKRACSDLARDLKKDKRRGYGKKYGGDISREEMLDARQRLILHLEAFKQAADADLASLLKAELSAVIDLYEDLKRRGGKLDFVDLLLKSRDLLRDDRDVRAYLQERFRYIFVDEFQDTDPLQAEILLLLAADDPDCDDWRQARPRSGHLFLVGDPKQSIYRFRRADVVLYQQIKRNLADAGVGVVELRRSFRSIRPLQVANQCGLCSRHDRRRAKRSAGLRAARGSRSGHRQPAFTGSAAGPETVLEVPAEGDRLGDR